jgi:hypothetical protein
VPDPRTLTKARLRPLLWVAVPARASRITDYGYMSYAGASLFSYEEEIRQLANVKLFAANPHTYAHNTSGSRHSSHSRSHMILKKCPWRSYTAGRCQKHYSKCKTRQSTHTDTQCVYVKSHLGPEAWVNAAQLNYAHSSSVKRPVG